MDKGLLILFLLLAGCTTSGSLCTAGPIILDPADRLSRGTLEQIVTLNSAGQEICGWKANVSN